jgi:AAA domain
VSAAPSHDQDIHRDLQIARDLARAGVPIFVAPPDPSNPSGFALPKRWQWTTPDPAVVDRWRSGWAMCAVMGAKLDLLDVDPRNGGDASRAMLSAAGMWPASYARASTPSGGTHDFVAPLGVGSRDAVAPGFDVKGGRPGRISEAGRGFAFIAPTVKPSKVTGEYLPYAWEIAPDVELIAEGLELDDAGRALADLVASVKGGQAKTGAAQLEDDLEHTGPIRDGERHAKLISYAGRLRARGLTYSEAEALFLRRWADCEQPPAAEFPVTREEALEKLADVFRRYEQGPTDLVGESVADLPDPTPSRPNVVVPFPKRGEGEPTGEGRVVRLRAASSFPLARVRWLWDGRIAAGTFSLIAGYEGLGKSTAAYWVAARITRGELPGHFRTPRSVLVCATEDSWNHTIVPRLIAAGADLDRVFSVEVISELGVEVGLSLPRDVGATTAAALDQNAAMMLLDPLMSRLGSTLDSHKDAEVRLALEPLARMADQTGMSIVGLIHLNKGGSKDPLNAVMGSKAFTAVARSVNIVVRDPDDEEDRRRLFGTPKNNLGPTDLPLLPFTITSAGIDLDDGESPLQTSRIVWDDQLMIGTSIREVMERTEGELGHRSATQEARDWLEDYLETQGGEAERTEIIAAGRKAGHSEPTLKRVQYTSKDRIGTRPKPGTMPRVTVWFLKGEDGRGRQGQGDGPTVASTTPRHNVQSAHHATDTVSSQSAHVPRGEQLTEIIEPTVSDQGRCEEDPIGVSQHVGSVSSVGTVPPRGRSDSEPLRPERSSPLFAKGNGDTCPCGKPGHSAGVWAPCGDCGQPFHKFGAGGFSRCPACHPEVIKP